MRKVIVGDIHGCREEVLELLGSVRADWKKDMLIQMGDMVDRGPDPCGVLNVFREFKEEMGERCVLIRGNHEQILMECTRDPEQKDLWSLNGGSKTIRSCWEWGAEAGRMGRLAGGAHRALVPGRGDLLRPRRGQERPGGGE